MQRVHARITIQIIILSSVTRSNIFLDRTLRSKLNLPLVLYLGYEFVVIGQVCPAMYARVRPVTVRQIRLKRLDHDDDARLVSGTRLRVET